MNMGEGICFIPAWTKFKRHEPLHRLKKLVRTSHVHIVGLLAQLTDDLFLPWDPVSRRRRTWRGRCLLRAVRNPGPLIWHRSCYLTDQSTDEPLKIFYPYLAVVVYESALG